LVRSRTMQEKGTASRTPTCELVVYKSATFADRASDLRRVTAHRHCRDLDSASRVLS